MTPWEGKTVLVYDLGRFVEMAVRLTRDFGRVLYFMPWKENCPSGAIADIGNGIPGVERVLNFWDVVDEVDLFVFTDVYDGDLQVQLRNMGKRVWGSGKGEELELDRWRFKELLQEIGLPVLKAEKVIGTDALRARLQEVEDKHLKLSRFRGDMETFYHKTYDQTLPWLDERVHVWGARAARMEFILEDHLGGEEIAYDGPTVDGAFPSQSMFGYEIKDALYVGKIKKYDQLPKSISTVNEHLSPILKQLQYRNFFACETRQVTRNRFYPLDPCARMGTPTGEAYLELYTNLPEMLWYGAEGLLIDPEFAAPYVCELLMLSDWVQTDTLKVDIPDDLRQWVKIQNLTMIGDQTYAVPVFNPVDKSGNDLVGGVIGFGETLEEAMATAKERAEQVDAYRLKFDYDAVEKAEAAIAAGEKIGVPW